MKIRMLGTLAACLGLAMLFFLPTPLQAQAVYGSIFGTVTDNTGAAIPNANITVTDEGKGTSVNVQSNGAGEFTVEHLIPDIYDVKIEISGFKAYLQKGISVSADTSQKVEAKLEVGNAQGETVEVSADAVPELKTDRADVATVFDTKTVADLPIGDRNFTNLQLLLPGAQILGWSHAADENPQASKQIQVDGQAFGGVAFQLDGTDNQDPILGIIVINPPLDAISETKITLQNFDAELGKAVSSVVTAQTKSGSNKFHGSAFDYRESAANLARNPFSQSPNSAGQITDTIFPPGLKNQFGGSIGGPVIKDKAFFFGDYQGVRQKVGTSALMTVPTAHLISTCLGQATAANGVGGCDFTEYRDKANGGQAAVDAVVYQKNGSPYPGNVIPTAQLSAQSLGLLKLLQPYAPNTAGPNGDFLRGNYAGSGTGLFNNDQWDARGDYQLNEKMHAFARFSRFTDTLSGGMIFGDAGGAGFGINNYGGNSTGANDSLAAGMDIALSSNLLTDFRLGYYRYNIIDKKYDAGTPFATQLGIPGLNTTPDTIGAPGFNITDTDIFGAPGVSGSNPSPTGSTSGGPQYGSDLNVARCNCPLTEREDQFQVVNNWTKIFGNHSLKMGADLRYARNLRVPSDTDRTGILGFGTGPTSLNNGNNGIGFATFVLGEATSFGRYVSTSTNAKEFQKRDFFYVQDTWRFTSNLTLNYGVRYEFYFPEAVNGKGNGSLMNLKDGYLRVAGYGSVPSNMGWSMPSNAWNPRLGVAYQLDPKTVIRAGYGRSFDIGVFGSIFGHVVTQNLPVLANQELSTGAATGYIFCLGADSADPSGCHQANSTAGIAVPSGGGPPANIFPAVPSNGLLPAPGYAVNNKARPDGLRLPTVDAWNLSIQRALTPTLSVTMAYVGNKGTHTLSAGDGNNTNPNEAAIFLPANYSVEGKTLHYVPASQLTNPDANGIDPDGGVNNTNLLQRYYGGSLAACRDPLYAAQSGVPAGACGWTQGISYYGDDQDSHYNALQITIAKQFSKGLSFTTNYAWQRGVDFNSQYATWLKQAGKGRNNDIREQQVVGYGLYQLPFGRNKMFAANAPRFLDEIIGGWELSPVVSLASGEPFTLGLSSCSNWTPSSAPCYPNGHAGSLKTHLSGFNPVSHNHLFFTGGSSTQLPSGFSFPGLDQIGNSGRNNKFGPYFFNTDLSLQKNFPIYGEGVVAQFRVDAFNAFNTIGTELGNPGGNIDSGEQFIGGMGPGANPRQLQFSLRVQF